MVPSDMKRRTRSSLHIGLSVISCLFFILVLFFSYSSSRQDIGLFKQPTGNVSRKYETFITPASWTFIIWAIIYTWMFVALLYALSQLCRRTAAGPVYLSPVTMPISFWIFFGINQALNITWLFVWDREMLAAAAVFLGLIVVTNWLCMYALHVRLVQDGVPLKLHRRLELFLLRFCVHNGLAVYTTWTTVAALINLDIALVYVGQVSDEIASTVITVLLTTAIVIFFILEATVLDKYTRWTLTPGFTLVWALTGVFTKNYGLAPDSVSVAVAIALAVASLTLLLRLILLAVLVKFRPLGGSRVGRVTSADARHNQAFQTGP